MCRNIHTLHNFEPAATSDEVHAAALQYVRKIAGTTKPSQANQDAFDRAVHEIAHVTQHLLDDLVATTPPKNRDEEAAKARARAEQFRAVRDRLADRPVSDDPRGAWSRQSHGDPGPSARILHPLRSPADQPVRP